MRRLAHLMVGVLVVLAGWAGVVASPAGAADSWSCTAVAQPSGGFLVSWTTPPATAFRVVIERDPYALDWYWAGRVNTTAAGSFFDTGNARGAIQMEYRIKALDTSRAVLATVRCSLTLDTHGLECAYEGDGTRGPYGAAWDVYPGDGVDYVVLVKAASSDRYWWQGRLAWSRLLVGRQGDLVTPKIRIAVRQNKQYVTSIDCIPVEQGPAVQIDCFAGTGAFGSTFFQGAISRPRTRPLAEGMTVEWYRQTAPGEPWELRYSAGALGSTDLPFEPVGTLDPAKVMYRVELWSAGRTALLDQAMCGPRNTTS